MVWVVIARPNPARPSPRNEAFVATVPADIIMRRLTCPAAPGDPAHRKERPRCPGRIRGSKARAGTGTGRSCPSRGRTRPRRGVGPRRRPGTRPGRARPTADEAADHYAGHLAETSASAFMYFSMAGAGLFRQTDALAYKKFRDRLLADCGSPTDPIEVMLIEQLALAHLNTGRLHHQAGHGRQPRSGQGLRHDGHPAHGRRVPPRGPGLEVLQGQAAVREAVHDGGRRRSRRSRQADAREGADSEQGSKPGDDDRDGATIPLAQEPQEGRGRPIEPGETARPKRRRA